VTNFSILEINTRDGMTDDAFALYMRGKNTGQQNERAARELRAFRVACKFQDRLEPKLRKMVFDYDGSSVGQDVRQEVYSFIRERFFRKYFPDGREI